MNSTAAASLWWRVALVAEQSRARERQHRPHALAAAGDQVAGERRDQRDLALHAVEDDRVDRDSFAARPAASSARATAAASGRGGGSWRSCGADVADAWRRQRQAFARLRRGMLRRSAEEEQPDDRRPLAAYRQSIDNIDAALIHMLAERFKITQAVGALQGARRPAPRRSRPRGSARSRGCARWPRTPISIPNSPRSSCASSSTK